MKDSLFERVVIAGGSGLLAFNWALLMRYRFDVHLLLHRRSVKIEGVSSHQADFSSITALRSLLDKINPSLIVNAAALTDVDECERETEKAYAINVKLAKNLANLSNEVGAGFIQISTDQLFDGEKRFYTEIDAPCPINQYGLTKWQGEKEVLICKEDALVLRTNFFGWGPPYRHSLSDWILNEIHNGKTIDAYTDSFFTPIYTLSLVKTAHKLIKGGACGIFNVVGNERLSKYEFALKVCDTFNMDKTLVKRGSLIRAMKETPKKAQRPLDMSLSNKKLATTIDCNDLSIESMLVGLAGDEHQMHSEKLKFFTAPTSINKFL